MNDSNRAVLRGMGAIAAVGVGLGLFYNFMGLRSEPGFGLEWIAKDRTEDVFVLEDEGAIAAAESSSADDDGYVTTDDPLAVMLSAPPTPDLPEIPELPRPIQMQLPVVKKLFDADAALFIDAREPDEYAEGHIPGALSLPFDTAVTDPARLESLPTAGRPTVVYCGGGGCEVSINLAWELLNVGHTRVTYFQGGYPEWRDQGFPIATGTDQEGS